MTKLSKKHKTINIEKCCIGDTVDMLNNETYNAHILGSIAEEHGKSYGCKIEVIEVKKISNHGFTSKRFEN